MTDEDVMWKRVPYQGGWLPVTYRDELARREQRINALQAENAAMREIVQAVAESDPETSLDHGLTIVCAWCEAKLTWPTDIDEHEYFRASIVHTPNCAWTKARALLTSETKEQGA